MKMISGLVVTMGAVGYIEQGGSLIAGVVALALGCYLVLTFQPEK